MLFNLNLNNKTQNVKSEFVRKLFNEKWYRNVSIKKYKRVPWVYFVTRRSALAESLKVAMIHATKRNVTFLGKKRAELLHYAS